MTHFRLDISRTSNLPYKEIVVLANDIILLKKLRKCTLTLDSQGERNIGIENLFNNKN